MSEQEIIEGNKLIAKFIGLKQNDLEHWINKDYLFGSQLKLFDFELKFHSSWDWLMLVIEKIELLGFFTRILDLGMGIEGDLIIERFGKTKLEGVYITIIEFIKWYNLCQDGN